MPKCAFITEIYLKNIWRDNWRFSIWCRKRTLQFWNITNLRFVAQLRLQQRKELGLELLSWWPKVENWFIWQLSAFIIQLTRPLIFILKGQLQITCFKIISRGVRRKNSLLNYKVGTKRYLCLGVLWAL